MQTKISVGIIGFGNIGGAVVHGLAQNPIYDISVLDIDRLRAQGKVRDMAHGAAVRGKSLNINVVEHCEDLQTSDIVVVTAGLTRGPGMEREHLLLANAEILKNFGERLRNMRGSIIVVTNPVDVMAHWMQTVTQLPPERVVGMAGVLDCARLRWLLAEDLGVDIQDVEAHVVGVHAPDMIPLWSQARIQGQPLETWLSSHNDSLHALKARLPPVGQEGAQIVKALGSGSAFYGPSQSVLAMIEAFSPSHTPARPTTAASSLMCSTRVENPLLPGAFAYMGAPVTIQNGAVSSHLPLVLTPEENLIFSHSCQANYEQHASLCRHFSCDAS